MAKTSKLERLVNAIEWDNYEEIDEEDGRPNGEHWQIAEVVHQKLDCLMDNICDIKYDFPDLYKEAKETIKLAQDFIAGIKDADIEAIDKRGKKG